MTTYSSSSETILPSIILFTSKSASCSKARSKDDSPPALNKPSSSFSKLSSSSERIKLRFTIVYMFLQNVEVPSSNALKQTFCPNCARDRPEQLIPRQKRSSTGTKNLCQEEQVILSLPKKTDNAKSTSGIDEIRIQC